MTIIKGVRVPADEDQPLEIVEFERNNITAIQHFVGGWFQVVDIERPDASIFCDEEAKLKQSPLNRRATLIWWTNWTAARQVDALMGDCLIVGLPDEEEGNTQSVPDELVDLLFHQGQFRYEVLVTGETSWHGNQVVLDDVFQAFNDGLALAERWHLVEHVRVVAVKSEVA